MRLFEELKRRNVFRVAGVYAVVGWLLAQAAIVLETSLKLPDWFDTIVVSLLLLGFPIALVFAWAFEITPDGMKLTANVPEGESIASKTGRRLDYAILAGIGLIAVLFAADRLAPRSPAAATANAAAPAAAEADAPRIPDASIAVLPFTDMSPDSDQRHLSDGLSEEILNVLVRIDGLKVASRTSSFQFRDAAVALPKIAEALGVRHILEGSVRKSGDTIRVTAQLIDARTDKHLWSETFDRALSTESIFAIQDDVANATVRALSARIGAKAAPVTVKADTDNIDAYELYLKANALFLARGPLNIRDAIGLYEEVTALDPKFARGWAGLASAYSVAPSWGVMDANKRDYEALGADAANRALALDPDLATPYAVLGNLSGYSSPDWERAMEHYAMAIAKDPNDANIYNWRALAWWELGFADKARADMEQCLAIDPAYLNCKANMIRSLLFMGETEKALQAEHELAVAGAFNLICTVALIQHYARAGDSMKLLYCLNLAKAWADKPEEASWAVKPLYDALINPTDLKAGLAEFEKAMAARGEDPSDYLQGFFSLRYYAFRAYDRIPPDTGSLWWSSGISPEDQRRLIVQRNLPDYWRRNGFPPQCRAIGKNDFECS